MYPDRPPGILDMACPVNWEHPLNCGLVADWAVTPLSGWSRGIILRDLVRGSHNPKDGTLIGSPLWLNGNNRKGGFGALSLSGATGQYVSLPAQTALDITGSITITAWINPAVLDSNHHIFGGYQSGGSFSGYGFDLTPGGGIQFWDGTSWRFSSEPCLTVSVWQHVVVSVAGTGAGSVSFYVNAIPKGINTSSVRVSYNGVRCIGARSDGAFTFNGYLDAVMLYNRALSAKEVGSLVDQSRRSNPDRWRWRTTRAYFGVTSTPPPPGGLTFRPFWTRTDPVPLGGGML